MTADMGSLELQRQVAQAVHLLNHDLHSCNRVAANQWLVQFQHTNAAWEVATSILAVDSSQTHDFEVELFAAQVLKRKIQNDAVNLSPEGRSALQNALLMSAKKFSNGPPQLLTQICVALSALVLRAVEWRKPVDQLFASLNELQGQGTGSNAVLELLTVLPEEVIEDQTVSVDSGMRWQFSQELLSHTGAVLEFLLQLCNDKGLQNTPLHERQRKVLRCLLSWVRRYLCFLLTIEYNAVVGVQSFVLKSLLTTHLFW
jgi:transportin-3